MLKVAVKQSLDIRRIHGAPHVRCCGRHNLFGPLKVILTRLLMWHICKQFPAQGCANLNNEIMLLSVYYLGERQVKAARRLWACLHRCAETRSTEVGGSYTMGWSRTVGPVTW